MSQLTEAERTLHVLEAERARKAEARDQANKAFDEIDLKTHRARALVKELKGAEHG